MLNNLYNRTYLVYDDIATMISAREQKLQAKKTDQVCYNFETKKYYRHNGGQTQNLRDDYTVIETYIQKGVPGSNIYAWDNNLGDSDIKNIAVNDLVSYDGRLYKSKTGNVDPTKTPDEDTTNFDYYNPASNLVSEVITLVNGTVDYKLTEETFNNNTTWDNIAIIQSNGMIYTGILDHDFTAVHDGTEWTISVDDVAVDNAGQTNPNQQFYAGGDTITIYDASSPAYIEVKKQLQTAGAVEYATSADMDADTSQEKGTIGVALSPTTFGYYDGAEWKHPNTGIEPFSADRTYATNDFVTHTGNIYRRRTASANTQTPDVSADWDKLDRNIPDYNNSTYFYTGEIVRDGTNNTLYRYKGAGGFANVAPNANTTDFEALGRINFEFRNLATDVIETQNADDLNDAIDKIATILDHIQENYIRRWTHSYKKYVAGDVAVYNNNLYVCILDTTNSGTEENDNPSAATGNWDLLTEKTEAGKTPIEFTTTTTIDTATNNIVFAAAASGELNGYANYDLYLEGAHQRRTQWEWTDKSAGSINFKGDAIEADNAYGQWIIVAY
ncbi:MAG: hypothetical protein N0C84_01110 [Candidatus Thiodiazotropha taylori]|uniref:Uncharacterized protein n=1 Tax=Candidatus Thiodiazotropha taylori TaxID=2792791 RepID=A0A9E4K9F2_9GAMM|nr:hypothetical protein [Candidatus Thiodiazotropha taylori]MCW4255045.1 hypothetical protein [Candidatus Thiodiazotropha taylori]